MCLILDAFFLWFLPAAVKCNTAFSFMHELHFNRGSSLTSEVSKKVLKLSRDLDFGLKEPRRSDLTFSGESQTTFILFFSFGHKMGTLFGHPYEKSCRGAENHLFMHLLDWRSLSVLNGQFFSFGLKIDTSLGHPYKKINRLIFHPIEKEHPMQILVRIGPTIWPATL